MILLHDKLSRYFFLPGSRPDPLLSPYRLSSSRSLSMVLPFPLSSPRQPDSCTLLPPSPASDLYPSDPFRGMLCFLFLSVIDFSKDLLVLRISGWSFCFPSPISRTPLSACSFPHLDVFHLFRPVQRSCDLPFCDLHRSWSSKGKHFSFVRSGVERLSILRIPTFVVLEGRILLLLPFFS